MKTLTLTLALVVLFATPGLAQTGPAELDAEMAAAQQKYQEWMEATKAFIGGTTFDEADLRNFIELWPDFAEIGEEEDDEEMLDYEAVLDDPRYQEFVAAHGLAGESWLEKSTRIITLVTKEQMAAHLAQAEAQLPEQLQAIEGQRAQYGEENYRMMKRSLESSAAMLEQQRQAWAQMPEPTASEASLLETYRDDLSALIVADGEDEDWDEEEWEED